MADLRMMSNYIIPFAMIFSLLGFPISSFEHMDQIKINGTEDMIRQSFTGSGSIDDPYNLLIGEIDIIEIENVEGHIILNCMGTSSDIKVKNVQGISIRNLTSTKGSVLQITECDNVEFLNVDINGFDGMINSESISVKDSRFFDCQMTMSSRSGSEYANTTYTNTTLKITDGVSVPIYNNTFINSTLWMWRATNINISQNTFIGYKSGILAEDASINSPEKHQIHENTFESCKDGFEYTGMPFTPRFVDFNIRDNYFGNCTWAIKVGHSIAYNDCIWRNTFYHNGGTGDNGSGKQVYLNVRNDVGSISWSKDGIGNCWWHHRSPDSNEDGIVDISLNLQNSRVYHPQFDKHPLTDRFEKIFNPKLEISSPNLGYNISLNHNILWKVWNLRYNITEILLKINDGDWINVTDTTSYYHTFEKGEHEIVLKAQNELGLINTTRVNIIIRYDHNTVRFVEPLEGKWLKTDNVTISWNIVDMDLIRGLILEIDGTPHELDADQRELTLKMEEGVHTIKLNAWDDLLLNTSQELSFKVDLTPPSIDIMGPENGSRLSNSIVTMKWTVLDNLALGKVYYRLDGGEWTLQEKLPTMQLEEYLNIGDHTLSIRTSDMAGWTNKKEIGFEVSSGGSHCIISPCSNMVTNNDTILFHWKNPTWMDISGSTIYCMESGEVVNVTGLSSYIVELNQNRKNTVYVRFSDQIGNYYEEVREIIQDTDRPLVDFHEKHQYVNTTVKYVSWDGFDVHGIDGYRYRLDDGNWSDLQDENYTYIRGLIDGGHSMYLEAVNMAGNSKMATWDFTVDTKPPEIEINGVENGSILLGPSLEMEWKVTDEVGIEAVKMDIAGIITEYIGSGNRRMNLDPGPHNLSFQVFDVAGNSNYIHMNFIMDNEVPVLSWEMGLHDFIKSHDVDLIWIAVDDNWIEDIAVTVDGVELEDITSNHISLTMADGAHIVVIRVIDPAGREASIDWRTYVDISPPELGDLTVYEAKGQLLLLGKFYDNQSGVQLVNLCVNSELQGNFEGNFTYSLDGLNNRDLNIIINVTDRAGWVTTFFLNLSKNSEKNDERTETSILAPILVVVLTFLFIMIAVGLGGYVLFRKRIKEERDPKDLKGMIREGLLGIVAGKPKQLGLKGREEVPALKNRSQPYLPSINDVEYIRPGK